MCEVIVRKAFPSRNFKEMLPYSRENLILSNSFLLYTVLRSDFPVYSMFLYSSVYSFLKITATP